MEANTNYGQPNVLQLNSLQDLKMNEAPDLKKIQKENETEVANLGENRADYLRREARNFLLDSQQKAEDLIETLQIFSDETEKVYTDKPDAITIKSVPEDEPQQTSVSLTIQQTATAQENKGASLEKDGHNFNPGTHTIALETEYNTYEIPFTVEKEDTNQEVLNQMASAINETQNEVKATVFEDNETDAESAVQYMRLTSNTTGTAENGAQPFQIKDKENNAVEIAGLNQTTTQAKDAVYTENGVSKTAKTNEVTLENDVKVILEKEETEEFIVEFLSDKEVEEQLVLELVEAFNGLLADAYQNQQDTKTEELAARLGVVASRFDTVLNLLGVDLSKNGFMFFDSSNYAIEKKENAYQNAFPQSNYSKDRFVTQLSRIAEEVKKDPLKFIGQKSVAKLSESNYVESATYSQQGSTATTASANTGLLFDSLF